MRCAAVSLVVACLPIAVAACTGAEVRSAESLLALAAQAQQAVSSEHFLMKLEVTADGQSEELDADGGTYLKGPHQGDFFVSFGTVAGAPVPLNATLVGRGQRLVVSSEGRTATVPRPQAAAAGGAQQAFDLGALAPFVENVTVTTLEVGSRTEDEVTGTLDGGALLANLPGFSQGLLSQSHVSVGDVKVSLFIPKDTHLIETALLDWTMRGAGGSVHLSMSWAITSIDKPLVFPTV